MAIFPLGGCVIPLKTTWVKRASLGVFFCAKKIQNQSTNGWVRAFYHLSMRQREILCSFIPKVLKSVKKWLSYCHFLPERSKKIKGNALINISAKSVSRFTFQTLMQLNNIQCKICRQRTLPQCKFQRLNQNLPDQICSGYRKSWHPIQSIQPKNQFMFF